MDRDKIALAVIGLVVYTFVVVGATIIVIDTLESANPGYGPVIITVNGSEAYFAEARIVYDYPDRFVHYKQNESLYRINVGNVSTCKIEDVGFVTKVYIITDIPVVV